MSLSTKTYPSLSTNTYPPLEQLLEQARRRIEVTAPELAEARTRRSEVAEILRNEFTGCRVYCNGSIAHGDALTPLVDVDLGIVIPDPGHRYGPGKRGPSELKERAAEALRTGLREKYGDLRIEVKGRKRSILIRFRDPLRPGWEDFTADVIVAIDNPYARGLYIPRWDSWDRSDPETHTSLVLDAIEKTDKTYSRTIRLLKHWARQYDKPALCSWHIKALALGCLTRPTSLLTALEIWFDYAIAELNQRDTPDPAHVGPDIKTPDNDRRAAIRRLEKARDTLHEAISLEQDGWGVLAHEALANFFGDPDMLPRPERAKVIGQHAARLRARRRPDHRAAAAVALVPARPAVRSWAP
ncbi:nucleotidyltransferase [Promicromonospora sp. NPDC019610]|uniref:nucleotidyltransferase n=1 Tax=Promicromonospora sp. NPDC019610 TaxID=3364405 RepID=UPI0037BA4638